MILDTFISTCTASKFGLGRLLCGRVRFRFSLDFSLDSFIIFFRVAGIVAFMISVDYVIVFWVIRE